MPRFDIASDLQPRLAMNASITSNTTTSGSIIDTAGFDLGIIFEFVVPTYTDGSYAVAIWESDDSGMAGAVAVPAGNIIGALPTLTAADTGGAIINKVGVFGTLRYLQVKVTSTSVTSGARVVATATQKSNIAPAATS